jgi:hypothetical protein
MRRQLRRRRIYVLYDPDPQFLPWNFSLLSFGLEFQPSQNDTEKISKLTLLPTPKAPWREFFRFRIRSNQKASELALQPLLRLRDEPHR